MKLSNFLKTLSLFLVAIVTAVAFASCSSDKDEPENPGDEDFPIPTVHYTELSGSWHIENIKNSETGKIHAINQNINIGAFAPTSPTDEITSPLGFQIWADSYDDLISYQIDGESYTSSATMSFYKIKNGELKSSRVGNLAFSLSSNKNGLPFIQSFVMGSLSFSNGSLISGIGAYGTSDNMLKPIRGIITMKKL